MPGVHVVHFCPMCLTARNGLRHPKSPIMSRTSPTRFDAWSSRGERPLWALAGHPQGLGRRAVRWEGRVRPGALTLKPTTPSVR
jgi:hypothetical protein